MFTPLGPEGTRVDYQLEFIPLMFWAFVIAYAIGIPVIIVATWLHYIPLTAIAWLIGITAVLLPLNVWFSERQASWLREYITTVLETRAVGV
jgi:hypothetical protein